jgi:hypothetical protein
MSTTGTDTIRRSVDVALAPEQAFELFTVRTATWWPFATHSVAGETAVDAVFEPRVGGRVYERDRTGTEHDWGAVTVWEPPRRLVLEWTLDPSCAGTEVEIEFTAAAGGTHVELTHGGWRAAPRELVDGYAGGWEHVLRTFAASS